MTQTDNLRPGHKGPRNPEAPDVTVAATVSAAAGKPAAVPVRVVHRGKAPARIRVTIFGLDARWAPPPLDLGILQPGDAAAITLTILPERGSLGASYPFTIAAEASSPATMSAANGRSRPVVGVAEATLVLDAAERVSMSLAPATPSAVFSRGIRVNITNPSGAERTFTLVPSAAAGASLRLRQKSVTIPAQQTVTVPGRLRVKKPTIFGGDNTHTFSVSAQGTGAPEWVEGTLRSKPLVGGGVRAVIGLVAIVAVWAALAVVFIPKISNAVKSKNEVTTSSTADGGSGSDGAGAKGGANGAGDGSGANGGAGSGDGTAAGDSAGAHGGHPAGGYVVSGTVTGSGAAGASATLQPVSLSGAGDDGSLPAVRPGPGTSPKALRGNTSAFTNRVMPAVDGSDDGAIGKIRGPVASVNRDGFRTTTLLTTDKGEFTFGGVTAPGYYLLTLAKAGYQTQRFLINSANLASPQPMKVQLEPGTGKLSGSVTGPGGAIGAATIVVTDGTVTLQTSSISASTHTGTPGTWTLDQVSTPGTYLVTASAPGLGSASKLVTLDASGSAQVDLQLSAGQGSIVGKVSGEDSLGAVGGLGGITVTAKGGDTTRTATTVTSAAMRGAFVLPNLPAPGDYTLTISGEGFLTQTRDVSLGASGGSVTVTATLSRADAVVAGMVTGLDANGKAEGGLGGVGLTLASNDVTMKTMTTSGGSAGSYQFTGVAPGSYVLTAVQFGRVTASATVELSASASQTVNLALKADIGAELPATAHIRGQVIDSRSSGPLTCDRALETVAAGDCVATVTVTAPKDPADESKGTVAYTSTATAALNYVYTIPDLNDPSAGLPPGLYTVTVKAPGYEDTVTHVQVAQGQTIPAPAASMPPLGIISGTVTTRVGTPAKASCVIAVPAGVSIPSKLPTSCALAADGNTCTATGITGTQPCALTSMGGSGEGPIGTYQIRGLTHGQYTMLLIAQDPEYTAVVNAPPIVTLDLGGDGQFNTVLDRLGRINLFVIGQDIVSGALTPAGAVPVKVTPTPALGIDTQNTAADGTLVIKGLNGRYSLAADAADRGSAQLANLAVGLNQEIDLTMTLTRSVGSFIGTVKADINGVKEPVAGVKVTIVGTVDYRSQTAVPGSVTVTTDADGCYAVKAQTTDLVPTNEACTQLAASPGSVGVMSFKSTHVTLNADTTGTATKLSAPMNAEITLGADASKPGTLPTMLLVADPPSFGSQRLTASGPSGLIEAGTGLLDLSTAKITVTSKPAAAQTVTITSSANGTLTFNDSGLNASNKAVPGTYTIQVQRPGFATLTATLTCTWSSTPPAGGNVCAFDKLELLQLPVITGTITVPAPLPSGIDESSLASRLTVTWQTGPSGTSGAAVTLGTPIAADGSHTPIPAGDTTPVSEWQLPITYADPQYGSLTPLPADIATPGTYSFQVKLPGYGQTTSAVVCGVDYRGASVPGAIQGCTPLSPTLSPLPRFSATAALETSNSTIDTDFSDVTAVVVGQPSFTLTVGNTDSDRGLIYWQDPNLPENVIAQGTYQIKISSPGYADETTGLFSVTGTGCTVGGLTTPDCNLGTITLKMYPVGAGNVAVDVAPPGAEPDWVNAKVTVLSSPGTTSQFHVTLTKDSADAKKATMSWTDDALAASNVDGIVRTGDYRLQIDVPGYTTFTQSAAFTCSITGSGAICAPPDITLIGKPVFTGTVAANPAVISPATLADAQFTVTGGPSGVGAISLTSDDAGTLTWVETKDGIRQPTNIVTPGATAYQISATLNGYSTQNDIPFKCAAGAPCDPVSITMKAASLLKIVLKSGATDVSGAKITFQGTSTTSVQLPAGISTYTVGQTFNSDGSTDTEGTPLDPDGTYTISVYAAGYEFAVDLGSNSKNVACTDGTTNTDGKITGLKLIPGGTTTCTIELTAMGAITGSVVWDTMPLTGSTPITSGALQGVTITATLLDANEKATSTSFSAQSTGEDGELTLTGSTTNQGLTEGTWRLTTASSLTGYNALDAKTNATVTIVNTNGNYSVSKVNPSAADGSQSWLKLESNGTVTIHLLPKAADLDFHLNNGSKDVTPAGAAITLKDSVANTWTCTVNANGNGVTASSSTSTKPTCTQQKGGSSGNYVTFSSIPRGSYTYSVTFSNSDYTGISSADLDFTPGTGTSLTIAITQHASNVSGTVIEVATGAAPIQGANVKLCTAAATTTTCPSVNNFSGTTVADTSTNSSGAFQFTSIPDGSYRVVVTRDGYATTVSPSFTVAYSAAGTTVSPVSMPAATRQSLSMTFTAPSGLTLTGATVTLTQTNNDGRVAKDDPFTEIPITGSGTSGSPYSSTLTQIPTGTYNATVSTSSSQQIPFALPAGSVAVTAGTNDQIASQAVAAVAITPSITFTTADCVPAPTGSIAGTIWAGTDTTPPTGAPSLSLTISGTTASSVLYLPRVTGTYSWSPNLSGLTAWNAPTTDPVTITLTSSSTAQDSTMPMTTATRAVTVTLTVNGNAPTSETATVTASCTDGGTTASHDATANTGSATLVLTTGSTWNYTFTSSPSNLDCNLTSTETTVDVACTKTVSLTLTLTQGDSTTVVPDGTAVALTDAAGKSSSGTTSGTSGAASITGLAPNTYYTVRIAGYTGDVTTSTSDGTAAITLKENSTTTTAAATVTVYQSDGKAPAVGATVTADPTGGTCTVTNDSGQSTCSGLTLSTNYTITASWTDASVPYSGTTTVTTGADGSTVTAPSIILTGQ